ncbi:hypothetical protein OAY12_04210 [Candidatus Pelagibacter sp.]|nr:hypothetical protein [Candidatus Pelagibacter sp.]
MIFLKRIFLNLNIILSSLLIIFIFYKSEIFFEGTNRNHYLKYYLFTFSYLIFSILIYKFSKIVNQIYSLLVFSIVLTLYLFEFFYEKKEYLFEKDLKIKIKKYKELSGKEWDQRTQYEVYKELLKTNKDVVPYFYPTDLKIDNKLNIFSLSGVSNSLTVFCNENGYYSVNSSDRYGFNNPDSEWESDVIDYVFLGDSFTHGYCVNRPHDIPSVIRENYNQNVLNLGYGRSGTLIEYATLREYVPENIKKIVLMYYEQNDIENLESELNYEVLLKYLKDENFSQNLKEKTSLIDRELKKHISSRASGKKYEFIRLNKTRKLISQVLKKNFYSKNQVIINKDNTFKELEKILYLIKKLSIEKKIDFYFVYLPSISRFFENEPNDNKLLYFDEVKSIINKLNIEFIDINKEVFEKEQNPLMLFPFELEAHYNIEGYKKVADTIYRLTRN